VEVSKVLPRSHVVLKKKYSYAKAASKDQTT